MSLKNKGPEQRGPGGAEGVCFDMPLSRADLEGCNLVSLGAEEEIVAHSVCLALHAGC